MISFDNSGRITEAANIYFLFLFLDISFCIKQFSKSLWSLNYQFLVEFISNNLGHFLRSDQVVALQTFEDLLSSFVVFHCANEPICPFFEISLHLCFLELMPTLKLYNLVWSFYLLISFGFLGIFLFFFIWTIWNERDFLFNLGWLFHWHIFISTTMQTLLLVFQFWRTILLFCIWIE